MQGTNVRWEGTLIGRHVFLLAVIDVRMMSLIGPGKILGNELLGGRPTKDNPLRLYR